MSDKLVVFAYDDDGHFGVLTIPFPLVVGICRTRVDNAS